MKLGHACLVFTDDHGLLHFVIIILCKVRQMRPVCMHARNIHMWAHACTRDTNLKAQIIFRGGKKFNLRGHSNVT